MQQSADSAHPPNGFLPSPLFSQGKGIVSANYMEVPYSAAPDLGEEPQSAGLLEYWRILRRRKGTLIVLASVGAVIGFLVTLPQTPIYQVHSSLEIVSLNQNFLNMKESNPLSDSGSSADSVDIQTQIKILQSASLQERVINKLHAAGLPASEPSRVDTWRKLLNIPDPHPVDPREAALAFAARNLKVRAAGQTRIIELTVDSPNPQTAAAFANTLTSEFIDQNLETRWKTTEHTGAWLSHELDDMRIRLEQSEDHLQQYANQAGLMFTQGDKDSISEEKLAQVQQALTGAQTDRIVKQSRWEMANSSPPDALPDILNDGTLRDYEAKLTELKRQLAEQRAIYKDDYRTVQRVQAQIEPIQTALNQARGDILKRIRNEYDEAVRKENLLATDYASQRSVVVAEGSKGIQYGILKREVESNRQLYDAMLQQLKQSSLASALRASNIHVVDPAKPPTHPYKPDGESSAGIGLLSGLILGAAFVVMQERADRSIQDPGETQTFLNLPELGVIPADDTGTRFRLRVSGSKNVTLDTVNAEKNGQSAAVGDLVARSRVELVSWQRKPSIVAESFRATLVSILFSGENGSRPRVLVVTSAGPAEGKSTVVSNLGIAIAEVNQKTLLIDADLRKPRQHDIFNLKNDRGLSELLRSKDPVSSLLEDGIIQETDMPDLYVLTSGTASSAATSLLYSNRMPELLQKLRTEFECILIDTPPMLQIPDARVLGRMVDRVVLVMRAGKTTRAAAIAARQRFSEDGTKMLGTILNDWNPRRSPNGYYGNYSGYYYGGYRNGYSHGYHDREKPEGQ
jgi:succinoglycan biosynthesis transport protein ExoP